MSRALFVAQPFVLLAAVLLDRWVTEATTLDVLVRPAMILAIAVAGLLVLVRLATGSWPWAALIADAALLFTLREVWPALVIGLVALAWPMYRILLRLVGRPSPSDAVPRFLARTLGVMSIVLLVLSGVAVVDALRSAEPPMNLPSYGLGPANEDDPNIYLLLLDGYPRADTLMDEFGIDNSAFLADLEDRGFGVSERARTNYNKTWLTLASMLNGAYIDEILEPGPTPDHPTAELRWLHAMLREAAIPDALSERGYVTRTVASAYTSTALTTADDYIDHGHLNSFEVRLMATSPWTNFLRGPIGTFLVDQQADKVRDTLDTLASLAAVDGPPQFVLAHVHSPHTPFVLGIQAADSPVLRCFPTACSFWEVRFERLGMSAEEYRTDLQAQLDELNRLTLDALDRLVEQDPNAVVIVFSDHGLRYDTEEVDEHFRSLLAARTPQHDGLFADDESPVNLLRGILTEYFGSDLEPLPYRAWTLDWTWNLRLSPITNMSGSGPVTP
jgi:hypothetical protein